MYDEDLDIVIKYKEKQYLLVDEFDYNNDKIYLFLGESDELYCSKVDNKYIPIEDIENVNKIIKCLHLEMPDYFMGHSDFIVRKLFGVNQTDLFSEEKKKKYIEYFIDKIKEANETEKNIDVELCQKRLNSVNYYSYNEHSIINFYHPGTNSIISNSDDIHATFHEMVHACSGAKFLFKYFPRWALFLIEGMTESSTSRILSKYEVTRSFGLNKLRFDLPEFGGARAYAGYVAIIRQMEVILGYHAEASVLNGTGNFISEFISKYGLNFTIKMGYGLKKDLPDIEKIQNNLLIRCFTIDFKKLKTKEDVLDYIIRLRNIFQVRGKSHDGSDLFYEKFYKVMFNKCIELLKEKNIDASFMDEYVDKPKTTFFEPFTLDGLLSNTIDSINSALSDKNEELTSMDDFTIKYKYDEYKNIKSYVFRNGVPFLKLEFYPNLISTCTMNGDIMEDLSEYQDLDLSKYKEFIDQYLISNRKQKKKKAI